MRKIKFNKNHLYTNMCIQNTILSCFHWSQNHHIYQQLLSARVSLSKNIYIFRQEYIYTTLLQLNMRFVEAQGSRLDRMPFWICLPRRAICVAEDSIHIYGIFHTQKKREEKQNQLLNKVIWWSRWWRLSVRDCNAQCGAYKYTQFSFFPFLGRNCFENIPST